MFTPTPKSAYMESCVGVGEYDLIKNIVAFIYA